MIQRIQQLAYATTLSLMAYIPFHAFISTWLISNFGHSIFYKSLKDIAVFLVFGALFTVGYLFKEKLLINRRLLTIMYLYILLNFGYVIFSTASIAQRLAGFDLNLRFLVFFFITYFVGSSYRSNLKLKLVLKIVIVGLGVVGVFGMLQSTLLPRDFLSHFGYDGTIIPSYFTIDGVGGLVRYSSTLRGPNVLGAYMVVAIPLLVSYWIFIRKELTTNRQILFSVTLISSILTLYFTYSRSAWIGLVVAGITYLCFVFRRYKLQMLIFSVLIVIAGAVLIIPNRDTYFIQQVVFHIDPAEKSGINSDDERLQSLRSGFSGIKNNVTGHGIGSAGTPSTYGDKPAIVENYFLDTAYQFGLLGLTLLLAIFFYVFRLLWAIRTNWLAVSLMSSFLGITVASMFWPVWSDETVAYTWWGIAGLVIGSYPTTRKGFRIAQSKSSKQVA